MSENECKQIEVRVESLEYVEKFAGLPPMVQDRLLRLARLLIGASQHEKEVAQLLIANAAENLRNPPPELSPFIGARLPAPHPQPATELLDTLANLAQWMRHAAEPPEVRKQHGHE